MKRALTILGLQILLALGLQAQVIVSAPVTCATSTDGTVVGITNPLQPPNVTTSFSGTLSAGNYFVQIAWYDAAGHITLPSSEVQKQLTATGSVIAALPSNGKPASALGMKVYIGATSGSETLQGTTVGNATYTQSSALTSGTALPTTNNTICAVAANDAGWPTGTGYTVTMTAPSGTNMPGFPMQWQLLGPGTTINVANGLPLYNGNVTYPVPVLARPYNHMLQSISGPLSLTGYDLINVGAIGVGTATPGWAIDVETGPVNASGGFIVNGGAGITPGNCLAAGSDPAHTFDTAVPCLGSLPTIFYQTLQSNGAAQTQEPAANFSTNFTLSTSTGVTGIDLSHVGTAGTYASPSSLTFDAFGRETAVTASSAVNTTCTGTSSSPPWSCYRVEADGKITEWGESGVFATGGNEADLAVTFPLTLTNLNHMSLGMTADACPQPACSGGNSISTGVRDGTLATTGFTAHIASNVLIGGSGSNLNNTIHVFWQMADF